MSFTTKPEKMSANHISQVTKNMPLRVRIKPAALDHDLHINRLLCHWNATPPNWFLPPALRETETLHIAWRYSDR